VSDDDCVKDEMIVQYYRADSQTPDQQLMKRATGMRISTGNKPNNYPIN